MATRIRTYKRVTKLPNKVLSRISKLHLVDGAIYPNYNELIYLNEYYKKNKAYPYHSYTKAVIHTIEVDGIVQGWALFRYSDDWFKSRCDVMLYVNRAHRKKGYAHRLLQKSLKTAKELGYKRVQVAPHDEASRAFFKKYGVKSDDHRFLGHRRLVDVNFDRLADTPRGRKRVS